jgi:hypothetical protein
MSRSLLERGRAARKVPPYRELVPLTSAEISQRLFVRGAQSNLDGLCMSRAELLRAIEVLKEAHIAFDQGALLESLRKLS